MRTRRSSLIFGCTLCLLLILSSAVYAESRFTEGFRGIAWQTHKDDLPDLGLSKKALKNIYKSGPSSVLFMEGKGNLDLSFDEIPLLSVFMNFTNQRFVGVDMIFTPTDREKIISILTSETGTPQVADGEQKWQLAELIITVTDRELLVTTVKE